MLIQCTKKLLNELKIKPSPSNEERTLFSWHANLLTVARRKTLVLMNDSNRYVIILHGLKAKDFKKLDELIIQAISEVFRAENIKEDVIKSFLSQSKEMTFTTTKDRTTVARLNKACDHTFFYERELTQESLYQTTASKGASRLIVGDGKNDYIRPNEGLYSDLEEWLEGSIFNSDAVVLHVTLELENHHVWRKIVVPKNITFPDLHEVLQTTFGWQDSHLHEFHIYASKPFDLAKLSREERRKPLVNLVCSKEAFGYDYGIPMKMETEEKLSDYLPAEITYTYDLGDDWKHHIVVEEMIDDYDVNYPVCLAGEGDAPPEDVGGEPGYDEFLATIADRMNPDYEHMRSWGIRQGYEEFSIEMVNRRLKNV
ncbi:plasmid pRiA4b ORF-3 family protein [Halalkalibacter kiskunsagensis]|uniref:Plasmid pRiA4b ORF-3 family protein n=1 Tax=Halalkalibacter kiskunsagensis TaxID=1548599 RepID=A0ABV6K8A1_9BACI